MQASAPECSRLAVGEREVAAIDAAIGRVYARMIVHDRTAARVQQRLAQQAGRGDEHGFRLQGADASRAHRVGIEVVDVDAAMKVLTGVGVALAP